MRTFFTCLLSLLLTADVQAQTIQEINSQIAKVVLFQQGAQVERTASQPLKPGKYQLVFSGISPRINPQSIQVKADGNLTVLGVNHQMNFLKEQKNRESIQQIEAQKEQWMEKLNQEKTIKNVFAQEEKLVLANQSIKGDATLKAIELKEAADFQRQRLTELYQKMIETDRSIKKTDQEILKLNKQLQAINQRQDLSTSEVVVSVEVKESTTAALRLSYLVNDANWFANYDVRVSDITHPIQLFMKANVRQQSGEDWKDVKLVLSTGNPEEAGTRPSLSPWYLHYQSPSSPAAYYYREPEVINYSGNTAFGMIRDENGSPVAGATVMIKGSNIATTTDTAGFFRITRNSTGQNLVVSSVGYNAMELSGYLNGKTVYLQRASGQLNEVVVTGYGTMDSDGDGVVSGWDREGRSKRKKDETAINTLTGYQPTTTSFEIENPYSIPNDGKLYTVDISHFELEAQYEYYCAPKLDPFAFLTAKITDWQELNLLPGEANLFFEGTYLGKSLLDVYNTGDTLNLSLGKDKGVVVKRTLLKEFSSKKLLANNRTDTRQYEISVRNNKPQPIRIIIEDQFPISTNRDIEVDRIRYEGAKLDESTKKLTWLLEVDPKKENKVQVAYSVKYPKDRYIQLD